MSLLPSASGAQRSALCPSRRQPAHPVLPAPVQSCCGFAGGVGRRQSRRTSHLAATNGPQQHQQYPRKPSPLPDDGPSTSGSSGRAGPADPLDPKQPPSPRLVQLLKRLKAPEWLTAFVDTYLVPPANSRFAHIARAIWITLGFITVALGRELLFPTPRMTPREVLYSDFVTLLDGGRVRAARLEAGTSRLFFDITRAPPAAAAAAAAVASAEATASNTAPAESSAAAAAAASAAAAAAASKASAAAAARQRFQRQFFIKLADKQDPLLVARLVQAGVEYSVLRASFTSALANTFLTALAVWLPLLPMLFLLRRMIDQRQGTGRAKKSSSSSASTPSTTFADVAGVDAAKEELLEVVGLMRQNKGPASKLKVKMPSGVLLCGPPGTGKTLLAKAVAGEAGVPFFAVSASEFVELFVGRGAARIRELFAEARKAAPCVVFIDELDGVGSRRGMGYNDERDQTLNQLLTELDGFDGRPGVLFLAATNRIDVLDPALLRPGRISRKVVVPLPDTAGRAQILGVHLRGTPLEVELEPPTACAAVAAATEGFSGAELANVVNEAALLAARESRDAVGLRDLLMGAQRTRFGVNGRNGASAFGGAFTQRLQRWLMDAAAAAAERRPVKVGSGAG